VGVLAAADRDHDTIAGFEQGEVGAGAGNLAE
jgi:hypothetical protein